MNLFKYCRVDLCIWVSLCLRVAVWGSREQWDCFTWWGDSLASSHHHRRTRLHQYSWWYGFHLYRFSRILSEPWDLGEHRYPIDRVSHGRTSLLSLILHPTFLIRGHNPCTGMRVPHRQTERWIIACENHRVRFCYYDSWFVTSWENYPYKKALTKVNAKMRASWDVFGILAN